MLTTHPTLIVIITFRDKPVMSRPFNTQELQQCLDEIAKIPISEVKYYLLLALNSIKKADAHQYHDFLKELTYLSIKLIRFLRSENATLPHTLLIEINQSYQKLREFSKTNTKAVVVSYAIINLGATLLSIFTGVLGGLVGSIAGLIRSIWDLNNPLSYLKDGAITGFAFGAAIGFRAPKKIFKDELTRQLKFCIDRLEECLLDMHEQKVKPFTYYKTVVKTRLLKECFDNNKESYKKFLREIQTFQIATLSAQFVSENLEGYLGHHACIILSLPNQNKPELIEFSLGESNVISRRLTQHEERKVTGEKIIEMMAFHQQLQETQPCTYNYVLTKMKAGENDCFRYIEKILLCTGQKTTKLQRFDGSENWIGKNIIGFFVEKLSPFKQNVFENEPCYEQNQSQSKLSF